MWPLNLRVKLANVLHRTGRSDGDQHERHDEVLRQAQCWSSPQRYGCAHRIIDAKGQDLIGQIVQEDLLGGRARTHAGRRRAAGAGARAEGQGGRDDTAAELRGIEFQ